MSRSHSSHLGNMHVAPAGIIWLKVWCQTWCRSESNWTAVSPHEQNEAMSCYFILFCILESVATVGVRCVEFFLSMKFQNSYVD